jgi:hypothetical protein
LRTQGDATRLVSGAATQIAPSNGEEAGRYSGVRARAASQNGDYSDLSCHRLAHFRKSLSALRLMLIVEGVRQADSGHAVANL